jgi:alkylation response protein AidB-like acyl-CoA dehydrogenase
MSSFPELRDLARRFAQQEIAPVIEQDEREERFRPELIRKAGELGLTGVAVDESLGGAGLGYEAYTVVLEEIGTVSSAYAVSVAVTGLPQAILAKLGNETQKNKYVPPLARSTSQGLAFA